MSPEGAGSRQSSSSFVRFLRRQRTEDDDEYEDEEELDSERTLNTSKLWSKPFGPQFQEKTEKLLRVALIRGPFPQL
jgi:hypothetical protein